MAYRTAAPRTNHRPEVTAILAALAERVRIAQSGFAWSRARRRLDIARAHRDAIRMLEPWNDEVATAEVLERLTALERERHERGDDHGEGIAGALALKARHVESGAGSARAMPLWADALRCARRVVASGGDLGTMTEVFGAASRASRAHADGPSHLFIAEEFLAAARAEGRAAVVQRALGDVAHALRATGQSDRALELAVERADAVFAARERFDQQEIAEACEQVLGLARETGHLWACERYARAWLEASEGADEAAPRAARSRAWAWSLAAARDAGDPSRAVGVARAWVADERKRWTALGQHEPQACRSLADALDALAQENDLHHRKSEARRERVESDALRQRAAKGDG